MNTAWEEHNAAGLTLASQGRWVDATRAFEQARALVEAIEPDATITLLAKDDIRARLMLNVAQCHFHLGEFVESRRLAERSCALRVALFGEDALVVARTRGDLAVILAASGLTDEAMSLLERAVSAVERKRGVESAHLLPLLTNAAQLLARGAPDRAAPYVARMKALVFAQQQAQNAENFLPSSVPAHSFVDAPHSSGADDHLLRAAVAQTADLLRSTPAANIALEGNAVRSRKVASEEPHPAPPHDFIVAPETINTLVSGDTVDKDLAVEVPWEYAEPLPVALPENLAMPANSESVDDTLFDLVEPPPPTLNAIPVAALNTDKPSANPFGFEVQYGIPSQLHESMANPTTPLPEDVAPPVSSGVADAQRPYSARSGVRAVGGPRRGSTQVAAMNRLWIIVASVAVFGAGFGVMLLYKYLSS